ncbi:MAG: UDP-glucose/GDP-mannose dehydrogenase family protein [Elusimicrobia bacterium]|nr:UDP-glucose/GDP-mannose dehydrogenase family protein [Elusimicrobiota bacterium]
MKVAIVGTGYVGLVTGACLAEIGHEVLCIDNNEEKIKILKSGKMPIYEPGLDELVEKNVKAKRLKFSTDIKEGVKAAELLFVAVSTPPLPDGSADLCYVEAVSKEIAENMTDYRIVVSKSTVPVETGMWIKRTIEKYAPKGVEYDVASNPEFLREGKAISDFLNPDRIVIGVESDRARKKMLELYSPLKDRTHILVTNIESAELIKHASNSFLALKISYINAVANVCEKTKADIKEVALGMGFDKRIGKDFLEAGAGFGGSCFPKDLSAFIKIAERLGYDFKLLKEVQDINRKQADLIVQKVKDNFMTLNGKTIAVLGLAFKPDTDDMRNAPSIDIIKKLIQEGARIRAYDPVATENAKHAIGQEGSVLYHSDMYSAVKGAEAILILTDWGEFKEMDFDRLKKELGAKLTIIDGRNMFEPAQMKELGINYIGIGR